MSDNPYLPGNYVSNTVVYTGTHDNPTTRGWFEELPDRPAADFLEIPGAHRRRKSRGRPGPDGAGMVVRGGASIAPLQDLLNLGREARMNVPGRAEGNWGWRCTRRHDVAIQPSNRLRDLTKSSNRFPRRR